MDVETQVKLTIGTQYVEIVQLKAKIEEQGNTIVELLQRNSDMVSEIAHLKGVTDCHVEHPVDEELMRAEAEAESIPDAPPVRAKRVR